MDRVAGWYERRMQLITFIIGIVISFSLNIDTIGIAKKLTSESDARIEMVKMASDLVGQPSSPDSTNVLVKEEMEKIIGNIKEQGSIISMGASFQFKCICFLAICIRMPDYCHSPFVGCAILV